MRSLLKLFTFIIFMGTAMFPIYAFASSSSGPQGSGEGTGTISGWTTSNIHYQLSSDPSFVNSVTFDLDAPAQTVSVKVRSSSTNYTSCINVHAYHWQCDFAGGVPISSMDGFHVVAVGN